MAPCWHNVCDKLLPHQFVEGLTHKTRGHKHRFCCTLISGGALSLFWFVFHLVIMQLHEVDSEVINNAGRLRYFTQRVGVLSLVEKFGVDRGVLTQLHQDLKHDSDDIDWDDTAAELDSTIVEMLGLCEGLLGQHPSSGAPEILDENVKDSLREWMDKSFKPLEQLVAHQDQAWNPMELSKLVIHVEKATRRMDVVVSLAAEASNRRIHLLLGISIAKMVMGVLWAFATAYAFGRLWAPYVSSYNNLQEAEQGLKSMLRAAFDLVVSVSPTPPFELLSGKRELDHLLGHEAISSGDASPVNETGGLLACARGPEEVTRLQAFLNGGAATQPLLTRGGSRDFVKKAWWNLVPLERAQTPLPVAPMIRSSWHCHRRGAVEQSLDVEILMVSRPFDSFNKGPIHLAVRRVALDADSNGLLPPPSDSNGLLPPSLGLNQILSISADPWDSMTEESQQQRQQQQQQQQAAQLHLDYQMVQSSSSSQMRVQRPPTSRGSGRTARTGSSGGSTVVGNHANGAWSENSAEHLTPPPTLLGLSEGNDGAMARRGPSSLPSLRENVTGLLEEASFALQGHREFVVGAERSLVSSDEQRSAIESL